MGCDACKETTVKTRSLIFLTGTLLITLLGVSACVVAPEGGGYRGGYVGYGGGYGNGGNYYHRDNDNRQDWGRRVWRP
jgi:hypothetical protein